PGHSILVSLGRDEYVANPSSHADHTAAVGTRMIYGIYELDEVSVAIGEELAPVRRSAYRAGAGRLGATLLAGVLAGLLLNLMLVRLVTRPLERLAQGVRAIGRGALGTTVSAGSNAELDDLAREITAMSQELDKREMTRMEQLGRARRLQAHLIGSSGETGDIEYCIEYHPADEIAGDFVDVIPCPNGDTLVCLADVVGHGVHAAMEAAVLKALLLSLSLDDASPAAILRTLNQKFYSTSLPEDFASMIIVRIQRDTSGMRYANAGHEPGCIRSAAGHCRSLSSTGLLLGVAEDSEYEEESIELIPGDVIVLLSDGITESRNEGGRLLGRPAVTAAICAASPSDVRSVALAALNTARRHREPSPSHDDETVIAVTLRGSSIGGRECTKSLRS
ncbi:MAG: SpoIIE family protein phosphatase, partial [Phycisphaerales bacterium]|nr:SpoIIE family protein phosphatase [Phycisphaerales bacterium]